MSIACEIGRYNDSRQDSPNGLIITPETHEYLHSYIRFLISQNLVQINYSDYLIDWNEMQMQAQFISPLTARGRALVEYIHETEKKLFSEKENGISVACERFVEMVFLPSDIERLCKIYNFSVQYNKQHA